MHGRTKEKIGTLYAIKCLVCYMEKYETCAPFIIATPVACSCRDDVCSYIQRAFKLLCPDFSAMIFSGISALNILIMDVVLNEWLV